RRLHGPEADEGRKFLALTADSVDREAARGQAVALAGAERAEVARAEEHDDLILVGARVQRIVRAEAAEPQVAPALRRQLVLAEVEIAGAVRDVTRALRRHLVDAHGVRLELAEVEEHQLERQLVVAPQRMVGTEADVAILVVAERLQLGRRL